MIARTLLQDGLEISRLIKGGWHLAGGHGEVDHQRALSDMVEFVEAGITTFDCANIYTGVEQLIGDFRRSYPEHARHTQVFTKFVPDLGDLPTLDEPYVRRVIDTSLRRLGVERLDAVQFHWWDYSIPGYVEAAWALSRLRQEGKIARVSVTNFDVQRLQELVNAGIPISTHQLQFSVLDSRPTKGMIDFCRKHRIDLLCYGTVAGGFLSERWLGQAEPSDVLANRSLVKYKLIINDFGGWDLFQELLSALKQIALKHHTDIASVATRVVLDQPGVAAAIVGATNTQHLPAHHTIQNLLLDDQDLAALAVINDRKTDLGGDVYTLERDRHGKHGKIMRYELTKSE